MSHDSVRGGEHQSAELTRGQELVGPFLNVVEGAVEARGDDARLVETAQKVDDNLRRAVVIDNLKLTNVTILLHQTQEGNNNLRRRAEQHLTLSATLSVRDRLQSVGKGIHKNHFE